MYKNYFTSAYFFRIEPCGACRHAEVRLQNLLEASRSFITFLSLPFLKAVATDGLCYG
jgi:hypothetical protein